MLGHMVFEKSKNQLTFEEFLEKAIVLNIDDVAHGLSQ